MMNQDTRESQTQPTAQAILAARIDGLEMKLAFLEHTVDALNDVVTQQDHMLATLQRQLHLLYQRLEHSQQATHGVEPFNPLADLPPHY